MLVIDVFSLFQIQSSIFSHREQRDYRKQPSLNIRGKMTDPFDPIASSWRIILPPSASHTHSCFSPSHRFFLGGFGFICSTGIKPTDIMYNPLPLYHSLGESLMQNLSFADALQFLLKVAGFVSRTGRFKTISYLTGLSCLYLFSLIGGCTTVLRKKFSASNFWKDCIKHKCTVSMHAKRSNYHTALD